MENDREEQVQKLHEQLKQQGREMAVKESDLKKAVEEQDVLGKRSSLVPPIATPQIPAAAFLVLYRT